MISAGVARKLLWYDSKTGCLFWQARPREYFTSDSSFKSWNTKYSGKEALNTNTNGYKYGPIFKKPYRAHRVIWLLVTGRWPSGEIDHIDGDRSNNKWENLRECSHSENMRNIKSHKDSSSQYLGVHWESWSKKWRARVRFEGASIDLGRFSSEFEAAKSYDEFSKNNFNSFGRLNFE